MKEIELTKGYKAKIDDEYFEEFSKYSWHVLGYKGHLYAYRAEIIDGKTYHISMHSQLMGRKYIDHKDGDGLNNQRHNLRPYNNHSENMTNCKSSNNTGYKGVYRRKNGLFKVTVTKNSKQYFGGDYATPEEAAIKYNELALQYQGEFARLNEIRTT